MLVAVLWAATVMAGVGCEAKAYQTCSEGEDRAVCDDEGKSTVYCSDGEELDADGCAFVADLGPERMYCCD